MQKLLKKSISEAIIQKHYFAFSENTFLKRQSIFKKV